MTRSTRTPGVDRIRRIAVSVALVPLMLPAALLSLAVAQLGALLDPAQEFDLAPEGDALWPTDLVDGAGQRALSEVAA